jgi:hypothetical protein
MLRAVRATRQGDRLREEHNGMKVATTFGVESQRGDEGLDPKCWSNGRATAQATRAAEARAASGRRRHVDPATCERDYSSQEVEFMLAMDAYKKSSVRMFPTWSEVLEVLHSLGYRKQPAAE